MRPGKASKNGPILCRGGVPHAYVQCAKTNDQLMEEVGVKNKDQLVGEWLAMETVRPPHSPDQLKRFQT